MNIAFEIVKYCIFFRIIWIDLKKRIIPEESFVILLVLGFILAIENTNLEGYYLGICAYSMPMIRLFWKNADRIWGCEADDGDWRYFGIFWSGEDCKFLYDFVYFFWNSCFFIFIFKKVEKV